MKPTGPIIAHDAPDLDPRSRAPFGAAVVILTAAFLLGGSSKDYVPGLLILRPLAVLALAIGLYHLRFQDWQRFRMPLGFMGATLGLITLHLVPLPPSIWMALPGRELAVAAGEAAGIEQPWRPLALVPYRAWNALYAMIVPAAVMVCAVSLTREQHRTLVLLALGGALISALWGAVQAASGYASVTFLYGVPRVEVPSGLFANRNHLAAILVCSVPIFALVASRARGPRASLTLIACAALGAFALMIALMTGSRAGMALSGVALAGGAIVWRARSSPKKRQERSRHGGRKPSVWAPLALAAFGCASLGVFALMLSQTTGFERIVSAGSGEVEEFRFTVWRTITEFAPSYMPVGSGIGSFVEVFKVHEPNAMLAHSYWNHAHNDWLEWMMEGGLPAALLMLAAVFGWVGRVWTLLRNRHRGRIEIQMGLAGAIILLILGAWSLVDYPLRTPALASLAALCAVWMAMADLARRKTKRDQTSGFATAGAARPMTG